jgi:outer membrane receptor protein involved in Fe transport
VRTALAVVASLLVIGAAAAGEELPPADEGLPAYRLSTIEVVATTPVHGAAVDVAKFPANVRTIGGNELRTLGDPSLPDVLDRLQGSATRVDSEGNPFETALTLRGFTASPVVGEPQGVAIYQNGVRLNEAFGDVVLWDLVPTFAVGSAQVIPGSNPAFGLNALGGALSLVTKTGFTFEGGRLDASSGSFGRADATAEAGARHGAVAVYGGVRGFREDGWRDRSPSRVAQTHLSLAFARDELTGEATLSLADSTLHGNGATPLALLREDRDAVFTFPDVVRDRGVTAAVTLGWEPRGAPALQASVWYRRTRQARTSGDVAEFAPCQSTGTTDLLCSDPGTADESVLSDRDGDPITASAGGTGALNRSRIVTHATGSTVEATFETRPWQRRNLLSVGHALEWAWSDFTDGSEVGTLGPSRGVSGSGILLGGDDFTTDLATTSFYSGLYAFDSFEIAEAWTITVAARWNWARLGLRDRDGDALDGTHRFGRVDPSVGVTWAPASWASLYASYAEASRIPTPAELGCADPTMPCRLPNAFVADPPLDPVVARSVEVGVRGVRRRGTGGDRLTWALAAFGSRNADDILFVSSGALVGSGYFRNAGTTQRVGLEASLHARWRRLDVALDYGLVRATFEDPLVVQSPNHPDAAPDGTIHVRRGDRMPNVPLHAVKAAIDLHATDRWTVGASWQAATSRFVRGDESNQLEPLAGYVTMDLATSYRLLQPLEVSLRLTNVFDTHYETFGVLGDASGVFPEITDPRFATPAAPRAVWVGLRASF